LTVGFTSPVLQRPEIRPAMFIENDDLAIKDEALLTPMLVRVSPGPVIRLLMPQNNSETLRQKILAE